MVKPLFVASIASLTLTMTSITSTITLLQQMGILPTVGTCSSCSSSTGSYKSEGLYNYFRCSKCKKKQSLLQNTVLSNSNTTLHDFVLLMYQFCNSHRTYDTVAKETFLPQDGYKETHLSRKALWPLIQANVAPKTMLHTDGWRAYRRLPELGYGHRWVDHSKNYVCRSQ